MSEKAIFLDRDDTVIDDPGYISEPEQVKLLPGAAEAVIQFKRMGYLVIIITNQSAIARGYMDEKKLEQIHHKLKSLLSSQGAEIDKIYYCPYHPDGTVAEYTRESSLRKPAPGMLQKAAEEMDIDLSRSWTIGDRFRDIDAGKAAGCHTILVDVPGKIRDVTTIGPEPDRKAVNLREAVNIIRMYEFHQKAQAAKKAALEASHPEQSKTPEPETPEADSVPASESAAEVESPPPPPMNETQEKIIPDIAPKIEDQPPSEQPQTSPKAEDTLQEPVENSEPRASLKFHTARPAPKAEAATEEPTHEAHIDQTHHLLQEILQRLKASGRSELYDDFSIHKLLAGLGQVLSIGCIVFSLVLWLSPKAGSESVMITVGYAIALQLLVISLLLMHRRD